VLSALYFVRLVAWSNMMAILTTGTKYKEQSTKH